MLIPPQSFFGRWLHRFAVWRWREVDRDAPRQSRPALAAQRKLALRLYRPLRRFLRYADQALAPALIPAPSQPAGVNWVWQPLVFRSALPDPIVVAPPHGTMLGPEIGLYHDCPQAAMILRQAPDFTTTGQALILEVMQFSGSYLSLVVEVPPDACIGLRRRHVVQLDARISTESPLAVTARMNLRHGPNTEQIARPLLHPGQSGPVSLAFDLAYTQLNEKRAEKIWIDLMLAAPSMNRITLHEITLCRYPRAEIG